MFLRFTALSPTLIPGATARSLRIIDRLRASALLAIAFGCAGSGVSLAQVIQCVSVTHGASPVPGGGFLGNFGNFGSGDGRYVVFAGSATLLGGSPIGLPLVRDRLLEATEGVSYDLSGTLVPASFTTGISSDGRYVVFITSAPNMVLGHAPIWWADVYLRDRVTASTELISVTMMGTQLDAHCYNPTVSADGRYVAFETQASTLVPGDSNAVSDVFLRDRLLGTTDRISVSSSGAEGNDHSWGPCCVSGDGRFVAFMSWASNLVAGDTNGCTDVFVRDRLLGTTQRVSVASDGSQGDAESYIGGISADGTRVGLSSSATNFAAGFGGGFFQAYVHNMATGRTDLVSVAQNGSPGDSQSVLCGLSADGRYALFSSAATNVVIPPPPVPGQVYVHDWSTGETTLASTSSSGGFANSVCNGGSISADGRYVIIESDASNLVPGDANGQGDVFIKDRFASGFTSLCDPGYAGVSACPCGNPPAGAGRGCENSGLSGGARLSASGNAYVSQDSLVFTSSFETPTATSILLQGTTLLPSGVVFGQGVRCAGGSLKRLYVKVASAGTISAPDFSAGDAPISVRSAQLGLPIDCGAPHLYLVFYRDPIVPGGCPAGSTFNATQTGSISWWP